MAVFSVAVVVVRLLLTLAQTCEKCKTVDLACRMVNDRLEKERALEC